MMVELPSEIWTMILEMCYERWQAELCQTCGAVTLTQCRAQVTARSVCRARRAAMQKFFLHLDVSSKRESAFAALCSEGTAGTGGPSCGCSPVRARLSVATSSCASLNRVKVLSGSCHPDLVHAFGCT